MSEQLTQQRVVEVDLAINHLLLRQRPLAVGVSREKALRARWSPEGQGDGVVERAATRQKRERANTTEGGGPPQEKVAHDYRYCNTCTVPYGRIVY